MPKDDYEALEELKRVVANNTWFKAVDNHIKYNIEMAHILEVRTITKTTLIRRALDEQTFI